MRSTRLLLVLALTACGAPASTPAPRAAEAEQSAIGALTEPIFAQQVARLRDLARCERPSGASWDTLRHESPGPFAYDPAQGRCRDERGQPGLNTVAMADFARTKRGQCADLRGQVFPQDADYAHVDLRGAALDEARVEYGVRIGAALEGTQLSRIHLEGGEGLIGTVDAHTALPQGCLCFENGEVHCGQ